VLAETLSRFSSNTVCAANTGGTTVRDGKHTSNPHRAIPDAGYFAKDFGSLRDFRSLG